MTCLKPILVCTCIDNTCQGEETVGPALLPFPSCWQEGSVQTVQIYCCASVKLLCLYVWDPHQVGHWTLVIRLLGPNPTHEMPPPPATCQKRQKLLLCIHILLRGSVIPSSIFTPCPHPSPSTVTVWHYTVLTQELQLTCTHSSLAL